MLTRKKEERHSRSVFKYYKRVMHANFVIVYTIHFVDLPSLPKTSMSLHMTLNHNHNSKDKIPLQFKLTPLFPRFIVCIKLMNA